MANTDGVFIYDEGDDDLELPEGHGLDDEGKQAMMQAIKEMMGLDTKRPHPITLAGAIERNEPDLHPTLQAHAVVYPLIETGREFYIMCGASGSQEVIDIINGDDDEKATILKALETAATGALAMIDAITRGRAMEEDDAEVIAIDGLADELAALIDTSNENARRIREETGWNERHAGHDHQV